MRKINLAMQSTSLMRRKKAKQSTSVMIEYSCSNQLLVGPGVIDVELDREDNGSISRNCDHEGVEITWWQNWLPNWISRSNWQDTNGEKKLWQKSIQIQSANISPRYLSQTVHFLVITYYQPLLLLQRYYFTLIFLVA